MVRHKLNGIQIKEPIGFDKFKSTIRRTDHHGVSIEMSVSELEFYGQAAEIINEAYNMDIDSKLIYLVESSCNGSDYEEEYSGFVDLSTYEKQENEYCSVKCKVGELGVKTTFNNRIDTKVDLQREQSMDGVELQAYSNLKKNVTIPAKGILLKTKVGYYTNLLVAGTYNGGTDVNRSAKVIFGFSDYILKEINNTIDSFKVIATDGLEHDDPQIVGENDCSIYFIDTLDTQDFRIKGRFKLSIKVPSINVFDQYKFFILIRKENGSTSVISVSALMNFVDTTVSTALIDFSLDQIISGYTIKDIHGIQFMCGMYGASGTRTVDISVEIDTNNYWFSIETLDIVEDSKSDVSFVHESLSRVSEIISGLTVKSDWYGRDDSNVNDTQAVFGGGSLKALVPGFWLRNAVRTNGEEYKFELSFKELISSLNAIDNIGWGFSVENGNLYIRVERWDWFYNNNVVLEINNPKSKKRTINADKIYTRLSVGYEKYGDTNDVNSIDTFHTKREYSTKLKAVDNEVSAISKFVACPYAIEFTRRKSLDKTTEDWRYDENTFIFCIARLEGNYFIETGVTVSDNTIISPETVVNARISPLRNAVRWSDRFFEVNRSIPGELSPLSSTGNAGAKCTPALGYDDVCEDSIVGVGFENQIIEHKQPRLKPETIDIETKLTKTQYNSLKKDPYGIIKVDGESCWLESVERDFNTSESVLKLIPKHE